ncbi:hypothetical protein [Kribbella sp. NPDC004875]|uniref:hypothetical protein n=1 Tax=Kribbella sp. NPDC004875 TaxID=3364107 RepID=UPI0036825A2A
MISWVTGNHGPADAFWYGAVAGLLLFVVWAIYSGIVGLTLEARDRRRTKS